MEPDGVSMGSHDPELIQRWQRGDPSAFEELLRQWQQPIGRFLFRLTGKADVAARRHRSLLSSPEQPVEEIRSTKDGHSQFDGLLHEVQGPARNQGFPADHDEEWPTCLLKDPARSAARKIFKIGAAR